MSEAKIDIIVISYNRFDLLKKLINSIIKYTTLPYTLTIIDNASTENKRYLADLAMGFAKEASKIDDFEVSFSETNEGYSRAINEGVNSRKAPFIMVLNNDVQLTQNWDTKSLKFMEKHPSCGILGYRLMDLRGVCKGCGVTFDDYLRGWGKSEAEAKEKFNQPEKVKYIGGSAMFIRRTPFDHIGGFNEEYFMYCEDLQISLDFKELGYSTYYIPFTIVHEHEGSLNTSKDAKRETRSSHFSKSLEILKKHYPDERGICKGVV